MIERKDKSAIKVLMADDDLEVMELLKFTFESEGYKVLTANDGEEALKKTKEENPDLVILDVNMPRLTGFEVCEKIRADNSTMQIPVIMLTSLAKTKDKLTGIKLGADEYLAKPFEPIELLIRVENILRRIKGNSYASTLTGLPGNISVENEIKEHIESADMFTLMYIDISKFKSFNDKYGFERGDNIIRFTANIIKQAVEQFGNASNFLGHIGADDFIILTSQDKVNILAETIIKNFDEQIFLQYDEDVRLRGYLWGVDKEGKEAKFPIMTISIGAVTVAKGKYHHYSQIIEKAKDALMKAKSTGKSSFEKV